MVMNSKGKVANNNLDASIVILGGGGGGLAAAVAAAEAGVKGIVVLEKLGHLGGNSAFAHGLFACGSPVQEREMIDCQADDCFKIFMNWAHWSRIDALVVRAYVNKSGDTIRWLEKKGLEFKLRKAYFGQTPVWHNPVGRGARLMKVLAENCRDLGVRVLLHTGGRRILRDTEGNVTGVMAAGGDGGEFEIKARSVIIATGGFAGNKELLKKYCPAYHDGMRLAAVPLAGDGLLMAAEAGAAIADSVPILGGGRGGPDIKMSKIMKAEGVGSLFFIAQEPYTIWVNKRGRRFADEGALVSGNAGAMQPDWATYTLFDDQIRQDMEEKSSRIGFSATGDVRAQRPSLPGLKEEIQEMERESRGESAKIADSWDEIARWIGAAPEALRAEIDAYNSCCDRGYDKVLGKERRYLRPLRRPPYYAIRCYPSFHDTMGGIKVSEHMEVRDTQDRIIPGLYAAGVLPDGFETDDYCWVLCGSAFGFAINSGRIAGESAAGYLSGSR